MNMMKKYVAGLVAGCALCSVLVMPVMALDADRVLERLESALNANNFTVTGGDVTTEGNNIIVENFGIETASLDDGVNLTLRLNDVVEDSNGSITIGRLLVDDSSLKITAERIDFVGFEIEQLYLPEESEALSANAYQPYKSIGVKGFTLYEGEKPIFNGGNSYARVSDFEAGKKIGYQGSIESFSFAVENLGGEPAQGMQDMGYETITGKVEFSGKANYESSLLDIENIAFTLDNIGTLSVQLQLGGYTSEVAESIASLKTIEDSNAGGLALIGLGQKLNFNSFSLRFDDNSLTNKVLDYVAKNMGSSRADVVSMASAVVQFGMAGIQHADFTLKVSQEIGSYLNAPTSIEVTAKPAQPLPLMMIAGAAQDPKGLIDMLNVDVGANTAR